jgi:hypothetical protein
VRLRIPFRFNQRQPARSNLPTRLNGSHIRASQQRAPLQLIQRSHFSAIQFFRKSNREFGKQGDEHFKSSHHPQLSISFTRLEVNVMCHEIRDADFWKIIETFIGRLYSGTFRSP